MAEPTHLVELTEAEVERIVDALDAPKSPTAFDDDTLFHRLMALLPAWQRRRDGTYLHCWKCASAWGAHDEHEWREPRLGGQGHG